MLCFSIRVIMESCAGQLSNANVVANVWQLSFAFVDTLLASVTQDFQPLLDARGARAVAFSRAG
jgi:hypothetical protein